MQRIPEPELMLDPLQVKAYSEADFLLSDKAFISSLERHLLNIKKNLHSESVIFDLGCGPGNISELLAIRWPSSEVIAIDGSLAMLSEAKRRKLKNESLAGSRGPSYLLCQISPCMKQDLGSLPLGDVVLSNSLLHHLKDPQDLWTSIASLSVPGALHFHRDLRRPSSSDEALILKEKYLRDADIIVIKDFLASLYASYSVEEVKIQIEKAGLKDFQVYEVQDRYLEVIGCISN